MTCQFCNPKDIDKTKCFKCGCEIGGGATYKADGTVWCLQCLIKDSESKK